MQAERFIDEPTSVLLDLVRGAAAFVVMAAHGVQLGFYTGRWPFSEALQFNTVLLFFVLSGLVIRSSVEGPRSSLRHYATRRARRILPVSIAAIAFSAFAYLLCGWLGAPGSGLYPYERLTPAAIIMPLLFLSERPGGVGPVFDPSYWSLCYEVGYYALFGAAFYLRGIPRILWIALVGWLAGPAMLLLLPVWLLGVWIATAPVARTISSRQGMILIAISIIGIMAWSVLSLPLVGYHALTDLGVRISVARGVIGFLHPILIGLFILLGFAGGRAAGNRIPQRLLRAITPAARWLAGLSFSLYLFHWPIFKILGAIGVGGSPGPVRFGLLLLIPFAFAALVSHYLERPGGTWPRRKPIPPNVPPAAACGVVGRPSAVRP